MSDRAPVQRQVAIVIDLNKCMGCQTCTVACKTLWTNDRGMDHQWWMTVTTAPGRGYPKDWQLMGGGYDAQGDLVLGHAPTEADYGGVMDFNYQQVFYGGKGSQVNLAPTRTPAWGPNWEEDVATGSYPNAYYFYLPRLCNHCARPACLEACPRGAIYKRSEDGVVGIDEETCRDCPDPVCMRACPFKQIYWNSVRNVAQKCHACLPRLEKAVAPACVRQCPGRCMWIDYLDHLEGTVHRLVAEWQVALPLHAEYGVEPNVYYVPPLAPPRLDGNGDLDESQPRVPVEYLRSLFGPRVDRALATLKEEMLKKRRAPTTPSPLLDLLITPRWKAFLGPFRNDPRGVST